MSEVDKTIRDPNLAVVPGVLQHFLVRTKDGQIFKMAIKAGESDTVHTDLGAEQIQINDYDHSENSDITK